ncbi:MAG: hypothetical protein WB809_04930 [Thermoplasmata archaeon]
MSADPGPPPTPPPRRRLSRSARIGLGLLFTFLGLFLLSILLPTDPGQFSRLLPVAAVGMTVLWLGGILMGIGSRS